MSARHIKKGDVVAAHRGASTGKAGKVLVVRSERGQAIVEGLNLRKKAMKRRADGTQGGLVEIEAPISISNLLLYCPQCKKGVRVKRERESGKPVRKCRKCGHSFDG